MVMLNIVQSVARPEDDYPLPERSFILCEIVEGDSYLFEGKGLEFAEIQSEGGSAEIENESGMLEDAIASLLDPEFQRVGWFVIEGFYGNYTKDYYGEVDCDFECENVREATDADFERFGMTRPASDRVEDALDEHMECQMCGDEHPTGVLEDGYCPPCCDIAPVEGDGYA